jgi:hypothetical protein
LEEESLNPPPHLRKGEEAPAFKRRKIKDL